MNNKAKKERHILALSGGKDSAALAVYLTTVKPVPNLEFVFCDTRHELPETYEFLKKIEAKLGIEVTVLQPKRDFEFWLDIFKGCLPSPNNRWCTRQLKIIPYEEFIGNDIAYSYIGLRADEDRDGYISSKLNIRPRYPFKVDGIEYSDVANLLKMSDLGFPDYYQWRSRSGCYFCFFQRKHEWIKLYDHHPELFQKAVEWTHKRKNSHYISMIR
ncbi:Uncharacterized protein MSMEG_1245 [Olavius algarvensis Delta 1 endosymbiont]|nr:Uncharacterized protein MSMEG_1245 [Olavius algarvensis Delta 1 endosymbiont]